MMKRPRLYLGFAAILLASGMAAGAEMYRWVDENGITNYSNNPPPKSHTGKPATIVEDRTSVYTPEKAVVEALQKRAQKPAPQPPQSASFTREPEARAKGAAAPPGPPIAYDPCMTIGDPNCRATLYDASPVFQGRRMAPQLIQPQLPPGATAGNVTGSSGYTAGQSASAPPPASAQGTARHPPAGASFTLKPQERDRERERR